MSPLHPRFHRLIRERRKHSGESPTPAEATLASKFGHLFSESNTLLWVVRLFVFFLAISIATDALVFGLEREDNIQRLLGIGTAILTLALTISAIVLDASTKNNEITTLSAIYFGLLLGFLVGALLWASLQPIVHEYL